MSLSDDDKPVPRRRFFREGLLELFKPLARSVEPMARVAEQIGALDQPACSCSSRADKAERKWPDAA